MFLQRLNDYCRFFVAAIAVTLFVPLAQAQTPGSADELIRSIATGVLDEVKADRTLQTGDIERLNSLLDRRIMPHVNFQRMTASAVGRHWRTATPEQQKRLQDEFKLLLVRTYAGALGQITDQTVFVKPLRSGQEDSNLIVNTEVRGRADPIQLDYRLEKTPGQGSGWAIFDLNVLGVWLIENYRTQFTKEINAAGIEGLINSLAERNKAPTTARKA